MSILSENMRYLRAQLGTSQQKVADSLIITRGRYAKYEDDASEPPIEILLKISRYYHVSIDLLVSVDLRKFSLNQLLQMPDNRILLPVAVDAVGENRIEIIPHKAKMGYLNGYSDPEYIESLQNLSLPFLRNGKYRAFPAEGDSMPPFGEGTYIVGKYVEKIEDMKVGKTYILVTRNDGFVYKRLTEKHEEFLTVSSDNVFFAPYEIPYTELLEAWEFACSIATHEFETKNLDAENVKEMFLSLKNDIQNLKIN